MKNLNKTITLTAVAALAIGLSSAQSVFAEEEGTGYYFGLELGISDSPNRNIAGAGASPLVRASYDRGYIYGGVIGYDFGNTLLEIELLRFGHELSSLNALTDGGLGADLGGAALVPGAVPATGELSGASWMVNGIYEFESDSSWTPYIGVGLGATRLTLLNYTSGTNVYAGGVDWVATVQGIAGIEKQVSDTTALRLSYRYLLTEKADVNFWSGTPARYGHRNQAIMLGFTYKLGAVQPRRRVEPTPVRPEPVPAEEVVQLPPEPAPAPKPEPQPEPVVIPGPFQVFFDWDSSVLTSQAMNIIRDAAEAYAEYGPEGVIAIGHTDSSGPEWYNDRLSMRRAVVVRDALVSLGVPMNSIELGARGERDQLVRTPDGVREPRNRRVMITLSMKD